MSLLSVRNSLDDAIHAQQDGQVLRSIRANPSPNFLLSTIVAYAGTALNQKYSSMVAVDELLAQYPALEGVLLDAWNKKSFKDIRNLLILQVPKTPTKTAFEVGSPPRTPAASQKEIDDLVNRKLETYRPWMEEYLMKSEPWDLWRPSSDDPRIVEHFLNLRIPLVQTRPRLLLHDLGGSIVDPEIVSEIFQSLNTQFINTSGSGKTRILLEGLWANWGFYITCSGKHDTLGSRDMIDALVSVPTSKGFTKILREDSEHFDAFLEHNRDTARRRFLQLLVSRYLLLRLFLQEARKLTPEGSLDRYRGHWLYFQLRPIDVTRSDAFNELTMALSSASNSYLGVGSLGVIPDLNQDIAKNYLPTPLYIVLDEAQNPAQSLRQAFRSDKEVTQQRSILREIVSAWDAWGYMIVAGTGLSITEVKQATESRVAKTHEYRFRAELGSFDSRSKQNDYVRRYLPPHILESESGQYLLHRIWSWLRGRHRFTAAFLDVLVHQSCSSPHKFLDEYIRHLTNMTPSDSPPYADKEPDLNDHDTGRISDVSALDFTRVIQNQNIVHRFGDIIYEWTVRHQRVGLRDTEKDWVEFGFARFVGSRGSVGTNPVIDEPLVILAAIYQLNTNSPFGLKNIVVEALSKNDNKGAKLEDLIALYLAHAFGPDVKLSDIFDFGSKVPQWAKKKGVEFVAMSSDGQYHKVDLTSSSVFSNILGHGSSGADDTVNWFKTPIRGICFPDIHLGPDIALFLRLPDGTIICLIVQVKWRSMLTLSKRDRDDAVSTLVPSEFYAHKRLTDARWPFRRRDVLDSVRKLGVIKDKKWFPDGLPFLRALACFPAEYGEQSAPIVHLNMTRCLEIMDRGELLAGAARAVVEKSTYKRTYGDFDDPEFPVDRGTAEKKQRRD